MGDSPEEVREMRPELEPLEGGVRAIAQGKAGWEGDCVTVEQVPLPEVGHT